nr:unnamed protein product [Callosobruchus analis]
MSSTYYAKISKTLTKNNISWAEYKANPYNLVVRDKGYRDFWFKQNANRKSPITWYGKQLYIDKAYHDTLLSVQYDPNLYTPELLQDYSKWTTARRQNQSHLGIDNSSLTHILLSNKYSLLQIRLLQRQLSKQITRPVIQPQLIRQRHRRYQKVSAVVRNVLLPLILKNKPRHKLSDLLFDQRQEYSRLETQSRLARQVQLVTRNRIPQKVTQQILRAAFPERPVVENHRSPKVPYLVR